MRAPVAVGVNVTVVTQFPRAATELPQVLVCEKSPLLLTLVTARAVVRVFLRVNVLVALGLPTPTLPKAREVGVSVAV